MTVKLATSEVSTGVCMKLRVLRDVTVRRRGVLPIVSKKCYFLLHNEVQNRRPCSAWPLRKKGARSFEMSGASHPKMQCNIPEDQDRGPVSSVRTQLHALSYGAHTNDPSPLLPLNYYTMTVTSHADILLHQSGELLLGRVLWQLQTCWQ